jgi:hypothetical protein
MMTESANNVPLGEISTLLEQSGHVVILERVARGSGATRWHYCSTIQDVIDDIATMRAGSRAGLFFDDRIRRSGYSDEIGIDILDIAASAGEVWAGREMGVSREFKMDFGGVEESMNMIAEFKTGEVVLYGAFPTFDDDRINSIVFTPPDLDGIARPQPV